MITVEYRGWLFGALCALGLGLGLGHAAEPILGKPDYRNVPYSIDSAVTKPSLLDWIAVFSGRVRTAGASGTPQWASGAVFLSRSAFGVPMAAVGKTAYFGQLMSPGVATITLTVGRQWEMLLVLAAGLLLGGSLSLLRPLLAVALGLSAAFGILLIALKVVEHHVWLAWSAVALGQIPASVAWSVRRHFHRLRFRAEMREATPSATTPVTATIQAPSQAGVVISDHTLVRSVGKGAYGEVWLARNAVGAFDAVKIVRRREFSADAPYERELRGIQKFMPVSRSHPGLVQILHVGRKEDHFFYIMELGDDQLSGQQIDPDRYTPRTLASDLAACGTLPPQECLQLGLSLTLALEHLHQQQLIHRDIKPTNIIYVHGVPKFADIGLVTELRRDGQKVSFLGTAGYIPPEGSGAASADVYALGKVLYEASMGRDRNRFPEVPTTVLERSGDATLRQLNEVIWKACETSAPDHYGSAWAMHADLLKIEQTMRAAVQ